MSTVQDADGGARVPARRRRWVGFAVDAGIGLFALLGTFTSREWALDARRPADALAFALVGLAGLAVFGRHRFPGATVLVIASLISTYLLLGYVYGPIMLLLMVPVYTLARHTSPRRSLPIAAGAMVIMVIHVFTEAGGIPGVFGVIPGSAWVGLPYAIGLTRRMAVESVSRIQAEAVRRQVDQERLRIAQEVHDIVGHGLVAMKMQADIALHLVDRKPEQARAALEAISRSSGVALEELRATLAAVRSDEALDERAPMPTLARLDELLGRAREAGMEVSVGVEGEARDLPAIIDVTGYRILQESLTNVLRHGVLKRAEVAIRYTDDALHLAVVNPVERVPVRGPGSGIAGMRQRVAALGGEFAAGSADGRRFEVRATLPWGDKS
ncbi:MAG: sensor histidine kinase [Hamadaea sp.]|nr:sensor histidine kinase [Hamadaea sp.]